MPEPVIIAEVARTFLGCEYSSSGVFARVTRSCQCVTVGDPVACPPDRSLHHVHSGPSKCWRVLNIGQWECKDAEPRSGYRRRSLGRNVTLPCARFGGFTSIQPVTLTPCSPSNISFASTAAPCYSRSLSRTGFSRLRFVERGKKSFLESLQRKLRGEHETMFGNVESKVLGKIRGCRRWLH